LDKDAAVCLLRDSSPFAVIRDLARNLYAVGGIGQKTMREYDDLCTPAVPALKENHANDAVAKV